MVSPGLKLLVAIAAGVVLAGPPVIALNLWLRGLDERAELQDIDNVAHRALTLAEGRIARVAAALDELSVRGVDSCRPEHVEALRQAMFATVPAKEFSIVAADGRTLCTDTEAPLEQRSLLSSEPADAGSAMLLEIVGLGPHGKQWIRLRRLGEGGSNGVAALVPAELLNLTSSVQNAPLKYHIRMSTRAGVLIGDNNVILDSSRAADTPLVRTLSSTQLALKVTVTRSSLVEATGRAERFQVLATIASGIVAILFLGIALLLPRRQPENPIVELERALEAGEIVPYYQPVVDIRSGKLKGAEVLARWRKPDGTMVLPATFIPLAESSGLIVELTRVLMRRVCRDVGAQIGRRPHLKIAFNLTARHFADEEIVRDVRHIFSKSPLRLSQVVLEVTERQPLDNLTETRRVIAALQGLGVRIAIDDVGSGHSGLSYMLKLGVDIIKIDKVFIDSLGTDRHSNTIIGTLIDLAQNMRMDIIAEGVETFEQVVALRDLGVRAAQGYVFAPPLPVGAFLQLVEVIDPVKHGSQMPPVATAR